MSGWPLLLALTTGVAYPAPLPEPAGGERILARIPAAFVANLGQWDHPARYVARMGQVSVFLEERGWSFTLHGRIGLEETEPGPVRARGVAVRMTFEGAEDPELAAEDRLPGHHNYFLGSDPRRWRTEVPLYGSVLLRGMYPGIDVRVREQDRHLEYDLLLESGADLGRVRIAVHGVEDVRQTQEGGLVFDTPVGEVRQAPPQTWEVDLSGQRRRLPCRLVLLAKRRFGFEVSGRTSDCSLVIDPGLVYSTYLGGVGSDEPRAVAVDASGAATVAGWTRALDFPTTLGAFDTAFNGNWGDLDVFVTRLSASGASLVYSTYIGGTGVDAPYSLALDPSGAAIVAGITFSSDLPTTPGVFDTSYNGGRDAFVTRLSSSGASLDYSTYLGGVYDDKAFGLAADATGVATLAGVTDSPDFPTTPGAYDTILDPSPLGLSGSDAFVARLAGNGSSLVFSTFLGGSSPDEARALALDPGGDAITAGFGGTDFPTTPGAYDTTSGGGFVCRLSSSGAGLVYSTFFGGLGITPLGGIGVSSVLALALDPSGAPSLTGTAWSPSFPTTPGAFDTTYGGQNDAFVTRLSPSGSNLVYSTFLGGTGQDYGRALAVDATGAVSVAGETWSQDFPPTPGAFQTAFNVSAIGPTDAFVSRLSPSGGSLVYSTFLGDYDDEWALALALDASAAATVTGAAYFGPFPTTPGAFDTTFNGSWDGFVTRLDMLPTGASAYGASTPGCAGPLAIGVTSWPQVGNATFALTCGSGPPTGVGILGVSGAGLATPLAIFGTQVWIDPLASPFFVVPVASDALGAAEVSIPFPANPALSGGQVFVQFFWPDSCATGGISASNALALTVQP